MFVAGWRYIFANTKSGHCSNCPNGRVNSPNEQNKNLAMKKTVFFFTKTKQTIKTLICKRNKYNNRLFHFLLIFLFVRNDSTGQEVERKKRKKEKIQRKIVIHLVIPFYCKLTHLNILLFCSFATFFPSLLEKMKWKLIFFEYKRLFRGITICF